MLYPLLLAVCALSPANDRLIRETFAAWTHVSRDVLRLPPAAPSTIVMFDRCCSYTFRPARRGSYSLLGATLALTSAPHGDSIALPSGARVAVAGLAFTALDQRDSAFFVAALPDVWAADPRFKDDGDDWPVFLRGVMLHELTHTRHLNEIMHLVEPAATSLKLADLDDDIIQRTYAADTAFSEAVLHERDLLIQAAASSDTRQRRVLIRDALAARKARTQRWFSGDSADYAEIERRFIDMEGVAVFAAFADALEHRAAGESRDAVISRIRGNRKFWSQEYGFAAFLALDAVAPDRLDEVFPPKMRSVFDLLDEATR